MQSKFGFEIDQGLKNSLVGGWWSGGSPEEESSRTALHLDGRECEISTSRINPELLSGVSAAIDVSVGFLTLILCLSALRLQPSTSVALEVLGPLVLGVSVLGLWSVGMYRQTRVINVRAQPSRCFPVLCVVGGVGVVSSGLYLDDIWPEVVAVTTLPLLMVFGARVVMALLWAWMADRGILCNAVAVIGERSSVKKARRVLRRVPSSALTKFRGYYVDEALEFASTREMLQTLVTDVRAGLVDEVVLISTGGTERRVLALARTLRNLPVDVRLYPEWSRGLNNLIGCPRRPWQSATITLSDKPQKTWGLVQKSVLDRVGALTILAACSPVFLALMLAVKASSRGPIFFVQKRFGYNCKPFGIYKFRSMYADQCDISASKLTLRDDPRVTPIGAFLRKTSLDELPQLLNVLMGDMSLVGPRPHVTQAKAGGHLYDDLIPIFHSRYRVKPGLTGLAQVRGQRGNTETELSLTSRFRSDLEYVRSWSLALDLKILLWTIFAMLRPKNAF